MTWFITVYYKFRFMRTYKVTNLEELNKLLDRAEDIQYVEIK